MNRRKQDIRAIKQLAADWSSGWLKGDADFLVSLYGNKPVVLPQDQPVVIGKKAIRSIYRSVLKDYSFASKGTLVEVEAAGDWGYLWSTYRLTATPKAGGKPIESKGKSVMIVRRQPGGAWKIVRLIDNSDGPPGMNRRVVHALTKFVSGNARGSFPVHSRSGRR